MKSLIFLSAICVCAFAQSVQVFRPQAARPQVRSGSEQAAQILRQAYESSPDGSSYQWNYETDNGIAAQEQGTAADGTNARGNFQYTSPEGVPIALQYAADENGFQPQGDHLPVAPPVPDAILRSIEWNAAHPEGPQQRRPQQFF